MPDSDDESVDPFVGQTLAKMDLEELQRFKERLEKVGRKRMVQILSYEIKARKAKEASR